MSSPLEQFLRGAVSDSVNARTYTPLPADRVSTAEDLIARFDLNCEAGVADAVAWSKDTASPWEYNRRAGLLNDAMALSIAEGA